METDELLAHIYAILLDGSETEEDENGVPRKELEHLHCPQHNRRGASSSTARFARRDAGTEAVVDGVGWIHSAGGGESKAAPRSSTRLEARR